MRFFLGAEGSWGCEGEGDDWGEGGGWSVPQCLICFNAYCIAMGSKKTYHSFGI